ncbi:N-acetyltransferase family protein [Mycolicibacterium setense]
MVDAGRIRVFAVDAPDLVPRITGPITVLLQRLVAAGAALGWVDPPSAAEVADLLEDVVQATAAGDSALIIAEVDGEPAGFGYWRRYTRPTHRPHADVEKVAVDTRWHGVGIGRRLMQELIRSAAESNVEVLTLDLRGDNERAARLYESLGFKRYGMLERFVAVGEQRYDKLFYALDLRPATP